MKDIQILFLLWIQMGFWVPSLWASDSVFTNIHHLYDSPRALGMGGSFAAVADDYSTIFYNPAGLARRDDGQINLSMEFNFVQSFLDFYKEYKNLETIQDPDQQYIAYMNLLNANYGKDYAIRMGLLQGIWARPNWSLAILPAEFTMENIFHNQGVPALDTRWYMDTIVAYGMGFDWKGLLPGRLSWGFTGKFVERAFAEKELNGLDLAVDPNLVNKEDIREGYTVDADLGFLYTPDLPADGFWYVFQLAKPTFAFVGRNLMDYGFNQNLGLYNKSTKDAPERLYRVFDFGMKWEYPNFWIFGGRGVLDVRDMGHPHFNLRKGSHIGFEFDWTMTSWWKGQYRVGLNQGFLAFGLSALLTVFRLDLATYGEDIGTYNNPKENRVYAIKLNIDI